MMPAHSAPAVTAAALQWALPQCSVIRRKTIRLT